MRESLHRVLAAEVSALKRGEAITIAASALADVAPLQHNGASWSAVERILENVVGSAYEIFTYEDPMTRNVIFYRLTEEDVKALVSDGGRTFVSPDRRDRFERRGAYFYPQV